MHCPASSTGSAEGKQKKCMSLNKLIGYSTTNLMQDCTIRLHIVSNFGYFYLSKTIICFEGRELG